jgi:gas vesicle protein
MSDTTNPDAIERDIENTREDLSRNLDALADRVSPGKVVGRQVDSVKGRFSGAKDAVMGKAGDMSDASGSAVGSVGDTASSAAGKVSDQAQGNPLAAGLIAFGAGWLVSSLLPASQAETKLAAQAVDTAKEHGQPLIDHAKTVGQEVGDDLKDKAAQAASEVKDSAVESAQTVKDEGQSAADHVKDDVR